MARITPIQPKDFTAEQAEAAAAMQSSIANRMGSAVLDRQMEIAMRTLSQGIVYGPLNAWMRSPAFHRWVGQDVAWSIPRDVQEAVTLAVGWHWRASFEFWAHAPLAEEAGLPAPAIDAIRRGERPDLGRPDLQAAYDVTSEFLATKRVSDETYARAVEALGEKGLVEVIGIAGAYNTVSMTLAVFDIGVPPGEPDPFAQA